VHAGDRTAEHSLYGVCYQGVFDRYYEVDVLQILFEPPPDAPVLGDVGNAVILVPGLGFDRRGARLGTGMGYYDRSLPAHPHLKRIGVTLDALIVDSIPTDPWDVPMEAIVTERELLIVGKAGVQSGDSSWT
jgi:5,10-methenyltetrahydrofolate synthetase